MSKQDNIIKFPPRKIILALVKAQELFRELDKQEEKKTKLRLVK